MEGQNCLDPGAAELLINLPKAQMTPFMLESAEPLLEALRARRRIRYWTFDRGVYSAAKEPGMLILAGPAHASTAAEAACELRAQLEPEVLRRGGRFFDARPPGLSRPDYAKTRYGGARGVRIYSLFSRHSTALAFASLRRLAPSTAVGQYELGFGSFFFMMDVLGLGANQRRAGLSAWLSWFAAQLPDGAALLAACREHARQELESGGPLAQRLRAFASGGWRASGEPLAALFLRHERRLRRIGPLLESNEPFNDAKYPRRFAIFHSYLHSHYSRLDISGKKELLLLTLLEAGIGAPRAA